MSSERNEEFSRLGSELRELRDYLGLSQMQVAILCEVDVSTVSRWERGLHQHTHRAKDRQIRQAYDVLVWAAQLQEEEPNRVFTLREIQDLLRQRELIDRRRRGGGRRGTGRL